MNGLFLLNTVNFISMILTLVVFLDSFSFLPMVKWVGFGIFIGISTLLFFTRRLYEQDYETFLAGAKRGFGLMVLLLILSIYKQDYIGALNEISPFVLIYLVSSIMSLRTLRQKQYAGANKYIDRMNLVYSGILVTGAIVLGEEHCRRFTGKVLGFLWRAVPDFLIKAVERLCTFILMILAKPFVWLASLLQGKKLVVDKVAQEKSNGKPWFNFEDPYVDKVSAFFGNNFVRVIIWGILISLVVYIVMKLFQKRKGKTAEAGIYEEEREFLYKSREPMEGGIKRLLKKLRPRENNARIRFYYGKFLERCQRDRVELKKSDTSAEINQKCGFNREKTDILRNIYLKVRYSDYKATGEDVKEFSRNMNDV